MTYITLYLRPGKRLILNSRLPVSLVLLSGALQGEAGCVLVHIPKSNWELVSYPDVVTWVRLGLAAA